MIPRGFRDRKGVWIPWYKQVNWKENLLAALLLLILMFATVYSGWVGGTPGSY